MSLHSIKALALASGLSLLALAPARADELAVEGETVELAALIPALLGTELGGLVVAESPLPGESRVVRASDIKAMLKAQGRDARGLDLPRSTRLTRKARNLSESELSARVKEAVAAQLAPCVVSIVSTLPAVSLGAGDYQLTATSTPRRESGRVPLVITLSQGERTQRISAQGELTCPLAVVQPGANVKLIAIAGPVRVSAPATVHQAGRIGDEVRVTNQVTKKQLRARVIDAQTVEVIK